MANCVRIIENAFATTESICHRVRRWRNAAQARRCASMALLKAERGFGVAASPEAMAGYGEEEVPPAGTMASVPARESRGGAIAAVSGRSSTAAAFAACSLWRTALTSWGQGLPLDAGAQDV